MDALCPSVESSTDSAHDRLTLGAILRAFLPALLHLLKLGKHKLRVLLRLAACGTPALGANSTAISESPLCCTPGDKNSTSIRTFTALSLAEH
jgi:hypothetical protein